MDYVVIPVVLYMIVYMVGYSNVVSIDYQCRYIVKIDYQCRFHKGSLVNRRKMWSAHETTIVASIYDYYCLNGNVTAILEPPSFIMSVLK